MQSSPELVHPTMRSSKQELTGSWQCSNNGSEFTKEPVIHNQEIKDKNQESLEKKPKRRGIQGLTDRKWEMFIGLAGYPKNLSVTSGHRISIGKEMEDVGEEMQESFEETVTARQLLYYQEKKKTNNCQGK